MGENNTKIIDTIISEITDSNMTFRKKMEVLNLLDKAFRKYYGKIYLSDSELDMNDILIRSM
jgi:hypothetical protein